jgi:hypothetical protein
MPPPPHPCGTAVSDILARTLSPSLMRASLIPHCNKDTNSVCHVCQLGRHTRLPFHISMFGATHNFDLVHCDLWTSPVASISGYKYYLVILDDCSHYVWMFLSLTPF